MQALNRIYLLKAIAVLVMVFTLCWASWQFGKMHAITQSYIYTDNGYYVIAIDGEEWLHFEQN